VGEGVPIGSGDGTVAGRALNGALRWTFFEQPGELVCAMSPTIRIDTGDGAQICADAGGFATREGPDARYRAYLQRTSTAGELRVTSADAAGP
jgi:hypothetical protein